MRGLATIDAEIAAGIEVLAALRRERREAQRAGRSSALQAIRADFEAGKTRPEICQAHRITIGQLAGFADRYGWKREAKAGRKAVVPADRLAELRAAVEGGPDLLKVVAGRFGVDTGTLRRYAIRHGWKRRVHPLTGLTPLQRATYDKLRPIVGREAALAEARAEVTA